MTIGKKQKSRIELKVMNAYNSKIQQTQTQNAL